MIKITSTTKVANIKPQQIYDWLVMLDEQKFMGWHPSHIAFEVREIKDNSRICYLEENIEGYDIKMKFELRGTIPGREIMFTALGKTPFTAGHMRVLLEPEESGTKVTHETVIEVPGLLENIVRSKMKKMDIEQKIEKHAEEEFVALEKILCK